jgi:hypothetical protein
MLPRFLEGNVPKSFLRITSFPSSSLPIKNNVSGVDLDIIMFVQLNHFEEGQGRGRQVPQAEIPSRAARSIKRCLGHRYFLEF